MLMLTLLLTQPKPIQTMLNCGKLISFVRPLLGNLHPIPHAHSLLTTTLSLFSSLNKKKDQLLQLSSLLSSPASSSKYSSPSLIRYLSILVISPSIDPQIKDDTEFINKIRLNKDQIQEIYDEIAKDIHKLSNKDVNHLMQVMLEREDFFDRRRAIFRSLDKNARSQMGLKTQPEHIYNTIRLLDSLKFPKSTTQKFLLNILTPQQLGSTSFSVFPPLPQLQIMIYALQNEFISLELTQKIMEGLIKSKVQKLDELALLYHIGQIVKQAVNRKLKFTEKKIQANKILFNPFTDADGNYIREQEKQTTQAQTTQVQQLTQEELIQIKKEEQEHKLRRRVQLQQSAGKIVGLYQSAVDQNKLQQSIIKSIHSQIQPLNKRLVMFLSSMAILRPTIQEFLRQNYKTMTPIEFMSINKAISPQLFLINYQNYLKDLQDFMSLPQKVYLAFQANRYAKLKITKARILQILRAEGQQIDYAGVLKIGKLIQNICEQDKGGIGEILKEMNKIIESKVQKGKDKN